MQNMFSAGELAKFQNISKQTLIFYDKIGLFRPAYTDPQNNYRYYSADQLDMLDTILIMKKIGFTLSEIRQHMKNYTTETSLASFRQQLTVLEGRIAELVLIKNRLEHRCEQVEKAVDNPREEPQVSGMEPCEILYCPVEAPCSMREISIATKKCYAQAFSEDLPIFFQCGVSVPLCKILAGRCTEASTAFLTTEPGRWSASITGAAIIRSKRLISGCCGTVRSSIWKSYRMPTSSASMIILHPVMRMSSSPRSCFM